MVELYKKERKKREEGYKLKDVAKIKKQVNRIESIVRSHAQGKKCEFDKPFNIFSASQYNLPNNDPVIKGANKGNKFEKLEFTCDVIDSKNRVKTLKGSYGIEFAKKYSDFVESRTGKRIKDYLNQEVEVVLSKRSFVSKDGNLSIYEFIQFLNILDENGTPIKLERIRPEGSSVLDV